MSNKYDLIFRENLILFNLISNYSSDIWRRLTPFLESLKVVVLEYRIRCFPLKYDIELLFKKMLSLFVIL